MILRDNMSMKYVLFFAVAILAVACGNKSKANESDTDSLNKEVTATDSLATQADGVEAAPDDLWTEDAVKAGVKKMYDMLNLMYREDRINLKMMDENFCTGYYIALAHAIAEYDKNAKGDMRFFGDEEGYRWLTDLSAPLTIEKITAELLTGNMARAQVKFKTNDEDEKGAITLDLWMENGQWRVNNFLEPEVFGTEGYIGMMEKYASEHNIHVKDNEPTEGAPTM